VQFTEVFPECLPLFFGHGGCFFGAFAERDDQLAFSRTCAGNPDDRHPGVWFGGFCLGLVEAPIDLQQPGQRFDIRHRAPDSASVRNRRTASTNLKSGCSSIRSGVRVLEEIGARDRARGFTSRQLDCRKLAQLPDCEFVSIAIGDCEARLSAPRSHVDKLRERARRPSDILRPNCSPTPVQPTDLRPQTDAPEGRCVIPEWTSLKSKVGRRLLLLFISCAVVPLTITLYLSFSHVTDQLYQQSETRLRYESKAVGMAILRELLSLPSELERIEAISANASDTFSQSTDPQPTQRLRERFRALTLIDRAGVARSLFGPLITPSPYGAEEAKHLASGKSLLSKREGSEKSPSTAATSTV